jgi:hypothetical protein
MHSEYGLFIGVRLISLQYGQGHNVINHPDGHKINPSVGISPTFSHCDSEKD